MKKMNIKKFITRIFLSLILLSGTILLNGCANKAGIKCKLKIGDEIETQK